MENGCNVRLKRITPNVLSFLLELVQVGTMLMQTDMPNTVTIVPAAHFLHSLPMPSANCVFCESPEELGILLSEGLDAWKRYGDQACG
jgi:hypothetical protein